MAAYSQPTTPRPPIPAAVSGNRARGMARTMATMSTANDSSSTGRVAMKASPSTTDRSPGEMGGPDGGMAGRRRAAYRAMVKMARSVA